MGWHATAALILLGQAGTEGQSEELRYGFTVKQGWTQTIYSERDLHPLDEPYLLKGVVPPLLRTPLATASDPLLLEGTLTLGRKGAWTIAFDRIEYWDRSQRWWIEFGKDKVRTFHLGGAARWSGSLPEWHDRLASLEASFGRAWLSAVTPRKPSPRAPAIGLPIAGAAEPGRRLFVTSCLEEQGVAFLLARLNGVRRETAPAATEFPKYPERAVELARALLDRMVLQASGRLAPEEVRSARSRSVTNRAWHAENLLVPSLAWPAGADPQAEPIRRAREELNRLAESSRAADGIDVDEWRLAVARQLARLKEELTLTPPSRATFQDALTPRLLGARRREYDFKERLAADGGRIASSEAEVRGRLHDADVVFFHSGLNRWRASRVRLETWYEGTFRAR